PGGHGMAQTVQSGAWIARARERGGALLAARLGRRDNRSLKPRVLGESQLPDRCLERGKTDAAQQRRYFPLINRQTVDDNEKRQPQHPDYRILRSKTRAEQPPYEPGRETADRAPDNDCQHDPETGEWQP